MRSKMWLKKLELSKSKAYEIQGTSQRRREEMSNWFGRYNVGIEAQSEDNSKWTIIKRQQSQQSNTRVEKRIEQCNNKNCVLKVAFKATTNKANNNILMLAACHSDQMQCIQNVFGSVDSAFNLIYSMLCISICHFGPVSQSSTFLTSVFILFPFQLNIAYAYVNAN